MDALQFLANGFMTGGVYALIALSLVMVLKATGIFNFAIGELLVIGGFLCWTFVEIGLNPWLSVVIGLAIAAIVGLLIERLALRPLIGQPILAPIMVTLALAYLIKGVVLLAWGGQLQTFPRFLPGSPVWLGDVVLSHELVWCFFIAMFIFGLFVWFFQRTRIGLAMRATAEGHQVAQARGIPVRQVFAITWAIGAMIACAGGFLVGYKIGLDVPLAGVGLKAFPAVLFGGLDSIPGAIIGGLAVGIIEALVGGLVQPTLGAVSPFIVLLLVLIVRPDGLFGLRRIERI